MVIRTALLLLIAIGAIIFIAGWIRAARAQRHAVPGGTQVPSPLQVAIGFVTNFFDTLGIGSFATTTTMFKMLRVVPDERMVGTMLMGLSLPVVAQAFIFLVVVKVDPVLLAAMIVVSILGSWVGARFASRLPRRPIQICIAVGLFAAALFSVMGKFGMFPAGGTALSLDSTRFVIALIANFVLGGVLMLGIGTYAPSMILFSVLGMDPRAAFPIMMGSGAMMGMVGGLQFSKAGRFDTRAALGLTIGGIPAVLIAGLLVRSLPLDIMQWMVIVVVLYAATVMARSAMAERRAERVLAESGAGRGEVSPAQA